MVFEHLVFFGLACFLLVQSSNFLVKSLTKISYFLKLSEFTIGFILISVATSLAEIFIGIISAINGIPELAIGNTIGSNIVDLTLVVGIGALLAKNINIESKIIKKDMVFMLAIASLPVLLMIDHLIWWKFGLFPDMTKGLSRLDGFILLAVFASYIITLLRQESKFSKRVESASKKEAIKYFVLFVLSLGLLLVSSKFVVDYAYALSFDFKLSPLFLGIFLLAIGTSLPELFFTTRAVLMQHQSMAIGDLVGSVITNSTLVIGITAVIMPISVDFLLYFTSSLFMLFSTFIFFTFAESDGRISWTEGLSLVLLYVMFVVIEIFVTTLRY